MSAVSASGFAVNLPTPMTAEARKALQGVYLDERLFAYSSDWGTEAWYRERYPGFRDEDYAVFAMYSAGVTPKQFRNMLKKAKRKASA
jgi:hypothetical protein